MKDLCINSIEGTNIFTSRKPSTEDILQEKQGLSLLISLTSRRNKPASINYYQFQNFDNPSRILDRTRFLRPRALGSLPGPGLFYIEL